MIIFEGSVIGIVATLFFDIFQISLLYAYKINKSQWNLIGRYFTGLTRGKFKQLDLNGEPKENNELIIGYIVHYIIGAIFGLFYLIINKILFEEPSLILAQIIGFITVLGAWCIIMPFALNIGFFASKKENQMQIIIQNLIAHYIFGIGLFTGFYILFN